MRRLVASGAVLLFLSSGATGSEELQEQAKTLKREPDPVAVRGREIPGADGLALSRLRLIAIRSGRPEPIPFDLNEFAENEHLYVLPDGPKGEKPSSVFGPRTELAFMAADSSSRLVAEPTSIGASKIFEIEITDPVDRGRGWVYLCYYEAEAPKKSSEDYVELEVVDTPDEETGRGYAEVRSRYYAARNAKDQTMWYGFRGTSEAGYAPRSFTDRLKVRFKARFHPYIPVTFNEEDLRAETQAWYDGAVRVIRRVKIYIDLNVLKIPIGVTYDVVAYDRVANVPLKLWLPVSMSYIASSAVIGYGLDLGSTAKGSYMFYANFEPKGFRVDGKMGEKELRFSEENKIEIPSQEYWHVTTGPNGTIMRRHITPKEFEERGVKLHFYYLDDEAREIPPESEKGQIGYYMNELDLRDLPSGTFEAISYWYYPPRFKYPDCVQPYLNILDRPLSVSVRRMLP